MRSRRDSGEVDLAHADILTPSWRRRERVTLAGPSQPAVPAAPAATDDGEDSDEAYVVLHEPLAQEERRRWTGTPAASDPPASPPASAAVGPTSPVGGASSLKRSRPTAPKLPKPCVPLYPPPLACWQTVRAAVKRHRDEAGAAQQHRRVVRRRRRALASVDAPLHAFAVLEGAFNREKLKLRRLITKKRGGPQRPGGGWSAARMPPVRSLSLSPDDAGGASGSQSLTAAQRALRREHIEKALNDEDIPLRQPVGGAAARPPSAATVAPAAAPPKPAVSSLEPAVPSPKPGVSDAANAVIDVDMEPPPKKAADVVAVTSLSSTPSPTPSPSPGPSPPPAGITQLPMSRNYAVHGPSITMGPGAVAASIANVGSRQSQQPGSAMHIAHVAALHAAQTSARGVDVKNTAELGSSTVNFAVGGQIGDGQGAGAEFKRGTLPKKDSDTANVVAKEDPGSEGAQVPPPPVSKSILLLEQAAADFEEMEQFYRTKAKRFLYQLKSLSTQAGWEPSKPLNFINLQKDFSAIKREEASSLASEGSDRTVSIGSYIRHGLDESVYPVLSKSLTLRPGYRLHGAPLATGDEHEQEPVVDLDQENGGSSGGIPPASPGTPKAPAPSVSQDLDSDDDANSLEGFELNMQPFELMYRRSRALAQGGAANTLATAGSNRNYRRSPAAVSYAVNQRPSSPRTDKGTSAGILLSPHFEQRAQHINRGGVTSAGRAGGSIAVTVRPSQGSAGRNTGVTPAAASALTTLPVSEAGTRPVSSPGVIPRSGEDADKIAAKMMMTASPGGNMTSAASAAQSAPAAGVPRGDDVAKNLVSAVPSALSQATDAGRSVQLPRSSTVSAGTPTTAVPSAPSAATGVIQGLKPFMSLSDSPRAAAASGSLGVASSAPVAPSEATGASQSLQPFLSLVRNAGQATSAGSSSPAARSGPITGVIGVDVAKSVPAPTVSAAPIVAPVPVRAATPSSPSTPAVTVAGSPGGHAVGDVAMKVDEEKECADTAMKLDTDEQLELSQDPGKTPSAEADIAEREKSLVAEAAGGSDDAKVVACHVRVESSGENDASKDVIVSATMKVAGKSEEANDVKMEDAHASSVDIMRPI